MTVLISADWHLSNNPRDAYRHEWQKQLRAMVKKHQPEALLVLGDICEAKDEHPAELVNRVVGYFHQLSLLCPVVVLKGNHDGYEVPFWAFLSRLERVYWIGVPSPASFLKNAPASFLAGLGQALFLPHVHDYRRDWANISFKGLDWVFAHATFTGAIGESGRTLEGVPIDIFPKGVRVISGDVHGAQTFGPVTYVGAPYTVDHGDQYDPRVLLIDDKGKLQSIPCTGPQKRLVTGTWPFISWPATLNQGDILKVRIELKLSQHSEWPEIKTAVHEWGDKEGFIVHSISPVITGDDKSLHTRKSHARKSDEQILNEYVKKRGVDENTAKAGSWLMRQT